MQWDNLLAGEGGREEHRLRGKLHLTVSKGPSALLQDELRMRGNSAPAAAHDPDKGWVGYDFVVKMLELKLQMIVN